MNVLQKKNIIYELNRIIPYLNFKKSKIKLVGSASLQSQFYSSDFDLSCQVKRCYKPVTICKEFMQIVDNSMKLDDVYFVELKIQSDEKKIKYTDPNNFRSKDFKQIDFVKIDYVVRIDNVFKEMSVMYDFNDTNKVKSDIISNIRRDIRELAESGQYYKVLKRLFSIHKINKDKSELVLLTIFFNGPVGRLYNVNSNLKAISLLLTRYDDPVTLKKVAINLKDINVDPEEDITQLIIQNDLLINDIAHQKYNMM